MSYLIFLVVSLSPSSLRYLPLYHLYQAFSQLPCHPPRCSVFLSFSAFFSVHFSLIRLFFTNLFPTLSCLRPLSPCACRSFPLYHCPSPLSVPVHYLPPFPSLLLISIFRSSTKAKKTFKKKQKKKQLQTLQEVWECVITLLLNKLSVEFKKGKYVETSSAALHPLALVSISLIFSC